MPSVMSPIDCSNARMRADRLTGLPVCLALLCLLAASLLPGSPCWLAADEAQAASAYTPRHSGMDAPGEPKRIESLPSKNAGRTAEGGMGYTDAYGNTIDDRQPEEKPAPKRPRPGAYGVGAGQSERYERPLPDPQNQTPAWSFK
ncbi:translation initiation factor IF-2 [Desulfovibrio desulfuricans]|uniref:translation initiation factor IF-2 n=2 Tax=Desulfovibrio desulfuricans TaxID=876 RepID=UPI0017852204|nr:translation initiation factor IF-2 [Desulfovibrio desulfuricans]MBD8895547.1 translation initiation factor IF-2 [Desulfovibrio desulfuricans]